MARLFPEHDLRRVITLDGAWSFKPDPENKGENEKWYAAPINGVTTVVPSVWNNELGMLEYHGVCWYQRNFYAEEGALRLNFGAVMTYAKVYLDGEYLGDHYGGFCRFDFIVDRVFKGTHTVTVRVDNSFDKKSIPQAKVDWYHYGGITRAVEAQSLKGIAVLYNRFEYEIVGSDVKGKFVIELYNSQDKAASDTLKISIDGKNYYETEVSLSAYEKKTMVTDEITVKDVKRWSPSSPNLYTVKLETSTDDLYDKLGFRFVEVKGLRVYLNGEETTFLGVNRHEDHPDFGMAFPPELMKRDIDIIANLGSNTIRGSHYPNNPTFVDMLDERGIMFWSEIPIWGGGFPTEVLGDPDVVERGLQMHKEMVKEYYNHPSVIFWGLHNEIWTAKQEAYDMSKVYYEYLKANGGNRIVTYASCNPNDDICLEFCDVISMNWYIGWYYNPEGGWVKFLEDYRNMVERAGQGHKPLIMSEFGAGAVFGHHTFDNIPWTEEYQANLLRDCIKDYFDRPECIGALVWQYCDIRTAKEMTLNRARGYNNKGLVNEYRRPKMAYYAVKEAFEKVKNR